MSANNKNVEIEIQRQYYTETAHQYEGMHLSDKDEHFFALSVLVGLLDYLEIKTILDIGSGTGRAITYIKGKKPNIHIIGIEPVQELREVAYRQGLSNNELIQGDGMNLQFGDKEFDLVCEFGVLHHVKYPNIVVSEMLRVARKAIFISDSNNFGQGSWLARQVKQAINLLGLWKVADFLKTKGKGYTISEGDGLSYSYSVFDNYKQLQKVCHSLHIINTKNAHINPYKTADHVAILGLKSN